MTQYQVTLDPQTLQRLFSGESQLGQLVEATVNQVLDAQVTESSSRQRRMSAPRNSTMMSWR